MISSSFPSNLLRDLPVRSCLRGRLLELSCPGEDDVLHIQHAMYGRLLDGFVCPNPSGMIVTNCSLNSSLEVVQTFCEGYHECKLPVEVASFGEDPCDGVFKYLDVDYKCISGLPVITDECEFYWEDKIVYTSFKDGMWASCTGNCLVIYLRSLSVFQRRESTGKDHLS